jgi:AAA ATPase domain
MARGDSKSEKRNFEQSSETFVSVSVDKEPRLVRPCPKCLAEWPYDWESCPNCAISLQGREITREITRLVPSDIGGPVKQNSIDPAAIDETGFFLACDFRCDANSPSPDNLRQAKKLMDAALGAIATHGGTAWLLADVGVIGCWDQTAGNVDFTIRAAAEVVERARPNEASWGGGRVSLGIGAVSLQGWNNSRSEAMNFAFRLASLAQPDGALVGNAVYGETVERFDYCGVCPAVAKSEPLPEPVFKLIGVKPEISGTHQTAPDTIPLVGRHELVEILDRCCQKACEGRLTVLHLIGDPGIGKSRLLREWLNDIARQNERREWIRTHVHGVPYGGYPLRGWKHLVNSLTDTVRNGLAFVPAPATTVQDVIILLGRSGRPTVIIVDDLHWIDQPSRQLLAGFLDAAANLPVFVIMAYRPSFADEAPYKNSPDHRRVLLRELGRGHLKQLIEAIARDRGIDVPCEWSEEIIRKARGNPLYAIEAIGYLSEASWNSSPASLPASLPELLIQRIRRTVDLTLPRLEQEVRLCMSRFASIGDSRGTLRRLELLEEQLASWLDRFDVFQQESPAVMKKFLRGLKAIDGTLALLNIFVGRQRPHEQRLAQGLARIEGLNESHISKS